MQMFGLFSTQNFFRMAVCTYLTRSYLLFIFLLSFYSMEGQNTKYAKVLIEIESHDDMHRLQHAELDIDHFHGNAKTGIEVFLAHDKFEVLENTGFSYEVLIPDYEVFYAERQKKDLQNIPSVHKALRTANNFDFGSMGGFYTLQEISDELDNMRSLFPNLISDKITIGTSVEGRPIYAVKISDNPDIDESEPTAYYDALHHAREPASMATIMNFMYWLLENYATDPQVQYIVNERELYFVPCVNPDGYEFNRQTNPNGGGLWRKNRRDNVGTNCDGVDLNRNYSALYGANNFCSSGNPCSEVYRGPNAFSEPETRAIRDFVDLINPSTAFTVHSFGNVYIIPDVDNMTDLQFDLYSEWATDFADVNDYLFGNGDQLLGGSACGTTDTYLHSVGVFNWTPEIGTTGFWPAQSDIFDLVDSQVESYFYHAWIAGAYMDIRASRLIGSAVPGGSVDVVVDVKNKGLNQPAQNVEVAITSSDPSISISSPVNFGTVAAQAIQTNMANPFTIGIPVSYAADQFDLEFTVSQDGVMTTTESITVFVGQQDVLFEDFGESSLSNWTSSGQGQPWSTCEDDAYSGQFSICDSEGGNSNNNTLTRLTLANGIDLIAATKPILSFLAKWSLEDGFDDTTLEISTNNGTSWSVLEEYSANRAWNFQSFDLSSFIGNANVLFRFTIQTDGFAPGDGFYFDDFRIVDYLPATDLCADGILNGMETDVDCGGPDCQPCPCDDISRIIDQITVDEASKYADFISTNPAGASIGSNLNVQLSAGNFIELQSNFEILANSEVLLYIDACAN